jgi:putative nucleotidyltransferase with HDIG domain
MSTVPARRRPFESIRVYVAAVCVVGALVVTSSALQLPASPHPLEWSMLAVMAFIAGRMLIKFPGVDAHISVSDTFFITSAVLFGPAPATVAMAADSLVIGWHRGWRTRQILFNGASAPLSLWLGAQLFFVMSGAGPLFGRAVRAEDVVLPLACFASLYFVLNSGLTACAVAIEKRISPLAVWRKHLGVISLNYFAAASATFFLLLVVQYFSLIALAAVMPLFAIFHLAMKSWTGRLADAEQYVATVDRLYLSTIGALSTAIEAKDGVTSSHIHRVQHYAMGLATALGDLDEQTMKAIQAAALLHDTGKLAVPERILNKPGKLTAAEFEAMKLHVDVGADILSSIDFPYPVVPIVRAHHENWDGTGYPNGLKGLEIPIGARILSVVDCYDALTSDRPYRGAMSDDEALAIVRARRGTMYDPIVVDTFERVCRDIAPMTVKPQLQKAIEKISKAVASTEFPAEAAAPPPPAPLPIHEGPESLRALANLARVVSGRPTTADLSSLIWSHVRHVVPNASCAFFVPDTSSDSVKVTFVAGEAASMLQGLQMKLGERLTGWVAENQQPIVNSEARLDLGAEAALFGLKYCLSLPLVCDGRVAGVLSLYSAEAFRDEQSETLQFVMPHLGQMFLSLEQRSDVEAAPAASRPPLRVVSSR